jgi:predicted transcriptional regulator
LGTASRLDALIRARFVFYLASLPNSSPVLRIPDPLRRELEKLCRQEKRALSEVVLDSLRRYVAAQRFQALRKKTLPFAEAQSYLTDEDVFKAIS